MTEQDILNIVVSGEGQKAEFKASFSDAVTIALTAFANAKGGAVYAGISDDGSISFFNPSGLYGEITETDLQTDNYRASTRNKQLADALHLTKDIEKYGSGFIRIRRAIADYPNVRFSYRSADYGFFAELNYEPKDGELNVSQNRTYQYIIEHPNCTAKQIAEQLAIPFSTVDKHIRTLLKKQMIERRGSKKTGGYWQILSNENRPDIKEDTP